MNFIQLNNLRGDEVVINVDKIIDVERDGKMRIKVRFVDGRQIIYDHDYHSIIQALL